MSELVEDTLYDFPESDVTYWYCLSGQQSNTPRYLLSNCIAESPHIWGAEIMGGGVR